MSNTNTAAIEFCTAALAAAAAHNILNAAQRTQLSAHVSAGAVGLDNEGYALADEVLWVLGSRCRSFTPLALVNLIALHTSLWADL